MFDQSINLLLGRLRRHLLVPSHLLRKGTEAPTVGLALDASESLAVAVLSTVG
jgi:hypothetical protein